MPLTPILFLVLIFAVALFAYYSQSKRNAQIRNQICNGEFSSAEEFEAAWANGRWDQDADDPGCYIIMSFDHPVKEADFSQPVHVHTDESRSIHADVHNHLIGAGDTLIASDAKAGRHLYVQFCAIDGKAMDTLAKDLALAFPRARKNKHSGK